ncbi:TPA: glycosyltransferase family 2 protein [Pseudomonas aeruginosa]|uniref:glycosyltransferase family 2 protein n=1 Tax=Pseudomonas aeruginosa TaxID=287 RepID=UPI00053D8F28|nr:glycosyltransferase family A protein [Pseudomonas aeruginosa]
MRCALVIPTRNAGAHLDRLLPALVAQRRQPDSILVVDSRSSDDTVERFRAFGARVEVIEPASFNHGGTRRWASQQVEADALIYLTQDAIPASPDSFANLLDELYAEADIGVAYGRERWIRAAFGGAGGEGKRYVLAEIQALRAAGALYRVPEIALRSAFKLLGYRLGQLERHLPVALKRRISMFPGYWK